MASFGIPGCIDQPHPRCAASVLPRASARYEDYEWLGRLKGGGCNSRSAQLAYAEPVRLRPILRALLAPRQRLGDGAEASCLWRLAGGVSGSRPAARVGGGVRIFRRWPFGAARSFDAELAGRGGPSLDFARDERGGGHQGGLMQRAQPAAGCRRRHSVSSTQLATLRIGALRSALFDPLDLLELQLNRRRAAEDADTTPSPGRGRNRAPRRCR